MGISIIFVNFPCYSMGISDSFYFLSIFHVIFYVIFCKFFMLFNGRFAFDQLSMLFNGNLRLEKLREGRGDGRANRRTDGQMDRLMYGNSPCAQKGQPN